MTAVHKGYVLTSGLDAAQKPELYQTIQTAADAKPISPLDILDMKESGKCSRCNSKMEIDPEGGYCQKCGLGF